VCDNDGLNVNVMLTVPVSCLLSGWRTKADETRVTWYIRPVVSGLIRHRSQSDYLSLFAVQQLWLIQRLLMSQFEVHPLTRPHGQFVFLLSSCSHISR
jgi:hypothetical protein